MRKTVQKCHQNLLQKTKMCFSFWGRLRPPYPLPGLPRIPLGDFRPRGVVPLRHVPPPDSIATVVNSLQNRVISITLCISERKNWENSPRDTVHSD